MKKILMMIAFMSSIWNVHATYTDDCITFSSAASFTLKTNNNSKNWDGTLWTSTDKINWTEWKGAEIASTQTGDMYNLYVRGDTANTVITGSGSGFYYNCQWVLTGDAGVACAGNIETLRGATGGAPSPTLMAECCYYSMFGGCTSLTTAPALPATTLASSCYSRMFSRCTSLMDAPALPATMLAGRCCEYMFFGCTSLTNAPALPAKTLAAYCYEYMFHGCSSLTTAPALPATTMEEGCYSSMFSACTSLTAAPALPATTMAVDCYRNMFSVCMSLTEAPALPATTMAIQCYCGMFSRCTALTDVPALPATKLAADCYYSMFGGCTSLVVNATAPGKEWKIPATSTTLKDWGTGMFGGTGGTFQGQPELNTTYYIASVLPNDDCITFSSAASFTLKTNNNSKNWDGTLWTSTDKINWTEWKGAEIASTQTGDTYSLYVRGDTSNTKITGMYTSGWWVLTGTTDIDCSGNIETLRGATGSAPSPTPMAKYCYNNLFYCCYKLTTAPALPATTLADYCYNGMFYCCYALKAAPALPATTLAYSCYLYMFYNCLALTTAPALPATTLADWCYCYMFGGCSSLRTAPELPAMTMKVACYEAMFHDCTSLTEAPSLPATTLAGNCYDSMFNHCTRLTSVPELPATELADYCYLGMFKYCSALKVNAETPGKKWKIPATTGATGWGMEMFDYTAGNLKGQPELNKTYYLEGVQEGYTDDCITFTSAASFTLNAGKGWNGTLLISTDKTNWRMWLGQSVTAAREDGASDYKLYVRGNTNNTVISQIDSYKWKLDGAVGIACSGNVETLRGATGSAPSPTPMAKYCYAYMFSGCTLLTSAPDLPAATLAADCYYYMFSGCSALTAAPKLLATTLANECYRGMFSRCTSLTDVPVLPATMLADNCYYRMFYGCTSLEVNATAPGKEWKIPVATTTATNWGNDMFAGTGGTLGGQPELNTMYYIASVPMYTDDCITFSSESSFTLKTGGGKKYWDGTLWTSIDKSNWIEWNGGTVSAAQQGVGGAYKLFVRGDTTNTKISKDSLSARWELSGSDGISCSGNIETLRGATGDAPSPTPMADYCYCGLFYDCLSLVSAPSLPATTLSSYCYYYMFDCTSLTNAPALPATILAEGCYCEMFNDCATLTMPPVLTATTLELKCYDGMFGHCTSLTDAPALPATTLANLCYGNMFEGCTSLTNAPTLPAMTLSSSCYSRMFSGCTLLARPPELPATTLAFACYYHMFDGCTSLTDAPALPAETLANSCYNGMFCGCTSLVVNTSAPGKEWKIPVATTTAHTWGTDMFSGTGGTLGGQPELNTTYYVVGAKLPEGGPYKETVDGIEWTFVIGSGLKAILGQMPGRAIPQNTSGAVAIPSELGGSVVERIGDQSFYYCSNLADVSIPSTVTNIGDYAFAGCIGIGNVILPDGLVSIGREAFANSGLTKVTIPSGIRVFGQSSFYHCDKLSSVTISDGVPYIGNSAFHYCTVLSDVAIPSSVTTIGISAFSHCEGLTNVTMAAGVTSIQSSAFDECENLIAVGLPSTLTQIGATAFYGCYKLAHITIPASVQNIGMGAFASCTELFSMDFQGLPPNGVGNANIKQNAAIRYNALYAAEWQPVITSCGWTNANPYYPVPLPEGGPYKETVDGIEWTFVVTNGEASVGGGSWDSPAVPTATTGAISIPSMLGGCPVTSVGYQAFYNCSGLTNVVIPSSVTEIGGGAFYDCSGLTSVTIPDGVTSIAKSMFYNCSGLLSVTIPSSVTNIGDYAFYYCKELTSVTIPSSVRGVGYWAFIYCWHLASVDFEGAPPDGIESACIGADVRYNVKYEAEWLPVVEACGWTNAKPYTPGKPEMSEPEIQDWVASDLGTRFAKPGESPEQYQARFEAKFGKSYTAAFDMETGKVGPDKNPLCVWHDYVAGTDPLDPSSQFKASVTIVDGKPVVSYTPELNEAETSRRTYVTYGKENLQDTKWFVVPKDQEYNYNFFKVTVEMIRK